MQSRALWMHQERLQFSFSNELTLMYASFVLHKFLDQTPNIDHSSDGIGIMFAPMYKADVDSKCFTSSNEKLCEHKVNAIEPDMVGDFVVFPSRCYHRARLLITAGILRFRSISVTVGYFLQ